MAPLRSGWPGSSAASKAATCVSAIPSRGRSDQPGCLCLPLGTHIIRKTQSGRGFKCGGSEYLQLPDPYRNDALILRACLQGVRKFENKFIDTSLQQIGGKVDIPLTAGVSSIQYQA